MAKCSPTKTANITTVIAVLNQKVTEERMPSKASKHCKCSKKCQGLVSNANFMLARIMNIAKKGNLTEAKDKVERYLLLCHLSLLHLILSQYFQFFQAPNFVFDINICYLPYNCNLLRSSFLLHDFITSHRCLLYC